MSRENVDVVRVSLARWNAEEMEALREMYDPGVIVRPPEGWPEPGPFVGRDAVMRQWEQLRQTFDDDALELLGDFIDAGERVAVRVCWRASGHGPEANLEMTDVFTVRKGRIFYLECFWDHAEALECLGLSEQDAHLEALKAVELAGSAESAESTTPDLVELARRLVEAGNARDTAGTPRSDQDRIDGVMRFFAPDTVFDNPDGVEVFEGRPAVRGFFEDWLGVYDEYELQVEDIRDLGNGVVFSVVVQRGKPRGSPSWVHNRYASVGVWVDGLIERTTNYADIDEARAAAERLAEERG